MPWRSWSGSSNGSTAPLSSRRTATLLTIASPPGIGVQRVADQFVDRAGAVVLGGVYVVDPSVHGGLEHGQGPPRSGGGSNANGPASCIAPYPDCLTWRGPRAKTEVMRS